MLKKDMRGLRRGGCPPCKAFEPAWAAHTITPQLKTTKTRNDRRLSESTQRALNSRLMQPQGMPQVEKEQSLPQVGENTSGAMWRPSAELIRLAEGEGGYARFWQPESDQNTTCAEIYAKGSCILEIIRLGRHGAMCTDSLALFVLK